MALRQQRARLRDLARAAGLDQHPRQPRMQRQPPHLLADRRQPAAGDEAQPREQRQRGVERVLARPFEPFERARIAAPGDHVEHGGGEIDAVNLRLAMRAQPIARVPQPPHDAWRQTSGAAGPLIRGVRPVMRSVSRLSMPRSAS